MTLAPYENTPQRRISKGQGAPSSLAIDIPIDTGAEHTSTRYQPEGRKLTMEDSPEYLINILSIIVTLKWTPTISECVQKIVL